MKKLFVVFLFFAMFFFAPLVEANGWLSGYYNRIKIPIDADKIDAALSDYPVLVKLTSTNFDFTKANSDGFDLRFTAADGTTLLKYERERHDSTNKLAEYWVKVPSVSSTSDTIIYLYYRTTDTADGADPENVWDSNYKAVHHLKDNTASSVLDSTSNNNDGAKKAANEPVEAVGKIGKAQDFDGTDDKITVDLAALTTFTIEVWFKSDITGSNEILFSANGGIFGHTNLRYDATDKLAFTANDADNYISSATITSGAYYYGVGTVNGASYKVYLNDNAPVSGAGSGAGAWGASQTIGIRIQGSASPFNGVIDELRISNIERSAAWIKASYHAGAGSLLKSFVNESLYGNFFLMF